jgi:predicted  nucleic acid-binding Zn-ribbon protein
MLQKSHLADEQNASIRRKQQEVLSENQELKGKLIDLRGQLMDKSVQLNNMEGNNVAFKCSGNLIIAGHILLADLAGTKRDANYTQKELSIEKHQKSALQSKVAALEDQVLHQKKEMKDLKGDAKEKLTSAGDHVRQTRHEVANLKAKVRASNMQYYCMKHQEMVQVSHSCS